MRYWDDVRFWVWILGKVWGLGIESMGTDVTKWTMPCICDIELSLCGHITLGTIIVVIVGGSINQSNLEKNNYRYI